MPNLKDDTQGYPIDGADGTEDSVAKVEKQIFFTVDREELKMRCINGN